MAKMSKEQYSWYLEQNLDKDQIVGGYMLKNTVTEEVASQRFDENVWDVVYNYPDLKVGKLYEMVLWNMMEMTPIDLFWLLDHREEFLKTGTIPDWDSPDDRGD